MLHIKKLTIWSNAWRKQGIRTIKPEEYFVKTNPIESIGHTFLVQNIKEEVSKYTKNITISQSREPDITFKNKKGEEIAIEIETGLSYKKNKTELINKFHETQLKYKKNLIIVLTDRDYKIRYQNIFPNIKILLRQDIPTLLSGYFKKNSRNTIPAKKQARQKKKQAQKH